MVKPLAFLLLVVLASHIKADDYRLPNNVIPSNYLVTFNFSEANVEGTSDEFIGHVAIVVNLTTKTSEIKLHSGVSHTINRIRLVNESTTLDSANDQIGINYTASTEILGIMIEKEYDPGTYVLEIFYTGKINTKEPIGLFRTSYQDENGNRKYQLATQFETVYARRAFPCFDEPALKATFSLQFTRINSNVTILSNTKQIKTLEIIAFETTPIMSSYLVAFVIAELECTTAETVDGVELNLCSRPDTTTSRDWAVSITPKILNALNEYTGINYNESMNKLDQVAVYASRGAMENWGMIRYSEGDMLYDYPEDQADQKQSVALVMSHETTHQWFGNLVTMQWWSEVFLNEGFAKYIEYKITQMIKPEWKMDLQFLITKQQLVLRNDEINSSPLQSDVSTQTEIQGRLGDITYLKGASIFRMVEHIMGGDRFKAGLREYLASYKYKNTVPENLWSILNKHVNNTYSVLPKNLNEVMKNWVKNSSFPLVTVTVDNGVVTISQKQFASNTSTTQWYVPISYTTSVDEGRPQSTKPRLWLIPGVDLNFSIPQSAEWIILNNRRMGYYRVNYDAHTWNAIARALKGENFSNIDESSRSGIIDDLMNLAKLDGVPYSTVFHVLEFLKNDSSYFTWFPTLTGFDFLFNRVGVSDLGRNITRYLLNNLEAYYGSTSFDVINSDDPTDTLKQSNAITFACNLGHADCSHKAMELFANYKENMTKLNPNLRSIIYCTALRDSTNDSDWKFLWEMYKSDTKKYSNLVLSLVCSKNDAHLRELLELTMTESIEVDNRLYIYMLVVNNPYGFELAKSFLKENYEKLSIQYGVPNVVWTILQEMGQKLTNQTQLDQLEALINELPESYQAGGTEAIETAKEKIDWIVRHEDDMRQYFDRTLTSTTN